MPERVQQKPNPFEKLKELMQVLREECPWDKKQTLASLRRFTIEETHELLDAIEQADLHNDWQALKNELGDLLLHIAFYARLAEEAGTFTLDDVVDGLVEKMIHRHPHVFGDAEHDHAQWERLKADEHPERRSVLDGIPSLPALAMSRKLQQRAARVGFDWPNNEGVLEKLHEEIQELQRACAKGDRQDMEHELGDILFALVNWARKEDLDAELALMASNRKFIRRFRLMERMARENEQNLAALDLEELERYYRQAKQALDE